MNHCPVSADERRYSTEQGMIQARQDHMDAQANDHVDRFEADLLSARKDNITDGYFNLKLSSESLELLKLILSELPDEVFGVAQELVKRELEDNYEI